MWSQQLDIGYIQKEVWNVGGHYFDDCRIKSWWERNYDKIPDKILCFYDKFTIYFANISKTRRAVNPWFFNENRMFTALFYAGDGTWTHTLLPASDFESDASAIPPLLRLINFLNKIAQARNILSYSKTDCKKFFDSCKNYFIHYFIRILEMKNVLWKIMIFRLFCWRKLSYMIT